MEGGKEGGRQGGSEGEREREGEREEGDLVCTLHKKYDIHNNGWSHVRSTGKCIRKMILDAYSLVIRIELNEDGGCIGWQLSIEHSQSR